jgi:hypothetical protein
VSLSAVEFCSSRCSLDMLSTVRRASLLICDTRDFDIDAAADFAGFRGLGLSDWVLGISGIERLSFGELVPERKIFADFGGQK